VFPCLLESPRIFCKISRTWKVLENDFGPGKYWKFKLRIPESPGIWWDVDAKIFISAHL